MLGHSPTTTYPHFYFIPPPKHVVTFFRPPGRYFIVSTCIKIVFKFLTSRWRTASSLWRHDCLFHCLHASRFFVAGVLSNKLGTMYAMENQLLGDFVHQEKETWILDLISNYKPIIHSIFETRKSCGGRDGMAARCSVLPAIRWSSATRFLHLKESHIVVGSVAAKLWNWSVKAF